MKRTAALTMVLSVGLLSACNYFRDFDYSRGARMTGGDPQVGREGLRKHSCTSCHVIPGIPDADGHAGPALDRWGRRDTFLLSVPNTPENLIGWIRNPSALRPTTTMPNMNLTDGQARDIAAYLFSINK
jgi:hypothetical protein